jgi:hypothetical protein
MMMMMMMAWYASPSLTFSHSLKFHFLYCNQKPQGVLRVEVIDDGAGIALEDQGNVFCEFSQMQRNALQGGGGSGLGLWISKRIIVMHNGTIGFRSEGRGKGCTFYFELPIFLASAFSAVDQVNQLGQQQVRSNDLLHWTLQSISSGRRRVARNLTLTSWHSHSLRRVHCDEDVLTALPNEIAAMEGAEYPPQRPNQVGTPPLFIRIRRSFGKEGNALIHRSHPGYITTSSHSSAVQGTNHRKSPKGASSYLHEYYPDLTRWGWGGVTDSPKAVMTPIAENLQMDGSTDVNAKQMSGEADRQDRQDPLDHERVPKLMEQGYSGPGRQLLPTLSFLIVVSVWYLFSSPLSSLPHILSPLSLASSLLAGRLSIESQDDSPYHRK